MSYPVGTIVSPVAVVETRPQEVTCVVQDDLEHEVYVVNRSHGPSFLVVKGYEPNIHRGALVTLTVHLPWDLAGMIHDAYEHELAGLAHEAPA